MENKLQHSSETAREFTLQYLQHITDNFSEKRIIGRGGFGIVYKGILDNREEIAVKKLGYQGGLGDDQFKNEVMNLMGVQHQNIVQLLGYCYETRNRVTEYNGKLVFAGYDERALCLEYLKGGSLEKHLSDGPCRLDWSISFGIIKGICEGLKHLHTGSKNPIYHLDLKPENILLDEDMIPKIGDLGLSRLLASTKTCFTQSVKGTLGYMPKEYIDNKEITPKFDVFSLGVIIIKIMAGRSGYSQCSYTPSEQFIELVHESWRERLQATMSADISKEVKTCIKIALQCVEIDRMKRPTITQIVDELDKIDNANSSSTSKVVDFPKKRDFNKIYAGSNSTVGFGDDEPIIIAPPNSVQLVMKNNEEAPLEENNQKVMLELTGGDSGVDRPGLDLVAVLDMSGSMSGGKLRDIKTAMQFIISKLCPIDRLCIVTFSDAATRLCPLRQVTRASRRELKEIVDSLTARGRTNMEAGLLAGINVLKDRKVSHDRVTGIMFMSDGQQSMRSDALRVPVGNVPVYTFGFGKASDSQLLRDVTVKSMGGTFSFARDKDGLTMAFSQCIAGLLTVTAQDLHLTVSRVGGESTIQKVTAGSYPQTQHADDPGSLTVAFGNLYSKETRRIIVDMSLPAIESERSAKILNVTYAYKSSSAGREFVAPPATLTVLRTGVAVPKDKGPVEVQEEEIRLQVAQKIQEARMFADAQNLNEARYMLAVVRNMLEEEDKPNPLLKKDLLGFLEVLESQELYEAQGRPYALASQTSHDRQRFATRGGDDETMRLFATPRMDKYLEQAKMFQRDPTSSPVTSAEDDIKEEIARNQGRIQDFGIGGAYPTTMDRILYITRKCARALLWVCF